MKRKTEKKRRLEWDEVCGLAQTARRTILGEVRDVARRVVREKDDDKAVLLCNNLLQCLAALGNADSALYFVRAVEEARVPRG